MRHAKDFYFHNERPAFTSESNFQNISLFPGMPAGVELFHNWDIRQYRMWDPGDQEKLVDNPAAPAGDGTVWELDIFNSATISFLDAVVAAPARMQITTGSTENDGCQLQETAANLPLRPNTNGDATRRAFLSVTFKINETSNDANTISQTELFLGFADQDPDVFATVTDYVGLHKQDGSEIVRLVGSGDADTTMADAGVASNLVDLSTFGTAGARANDYWLRASLLVDYVGQVAYGFMQNNEPVSLAGQDQNRDNIGTIKRVAIDLSGETFTQVGGATIAFDTGEAAARNLFIANIVTGYELQLG